MILPNPAVAERKVADFDDVTETTDPPTTEMIFMANPEIIQNEDGSTTVAYDEGDNDHGFTVPSLVEDGLYVSTPDGSIKIRAVNPYDAVTLAPAAGIAQPVEVVRAEVLQGGGALAQELDAVVAPDNTVATLMLETSLGTYVRYGGDWQLLSPDSDSLEDMSLVAVSPGAVDIWDAGEASGSTVNVYDLPNSSSADGQEIIQEPAPVSAASALTAAGISLPEINGADDLPLAVRFASAHPQARWYVVKRAKALGAADQVPAEWGGGVVLPFVTRAAV